MLVVAILAVGAIAYAHVSSHGEQDADGAAVHVAGDDKEERDSKEKSNDQAEAFEDKAKTTTKDVKREKTKGGGARLAQQVLPMSKASAAVSGLGFASAGLEQALPSTLGADLLFPPNATASAYSQSNAQMSNPFAGSGALFSDAGTTVVPWSSGEATSLEPSASGAALIDGAGKGFASSTLIGGMQANIYRSCQSKIGLWMQIEIKDGSVKRSARIGHGAYAEVYKGQALGTDCAIKLYRTTASAKQREEAMREIRLSSSLDHPCTLRLLGWVRKPLQTITELCSGDLKAFYKDGLETLQYTELDALRLLKVCAWACV